MYKNPSAWTSTDAQGYLTIAKNMWTHGVFSRNTIPPFLFDTLRTPGYPLFIIITGGLINPWITIFIQQLILGISTYLLFVTLRNVGSSTKISLLLSSLFFLDIPNFVFSTYLLSDTLFQSLLLASIYFLSKSINQKNIFLSLCCLAIACYVKPAALYFTPIYSAYILYKHRDVKTIYAIGFTMMVLSFWGIRNYAHHNRFIFSTAGEFNWCSWHGANIIAQKKQIPIQQAQYFWWDSLATSYHLNPEKNQVLYSKYIAEESSKLITKHPYLFVKQTTIGVASLWLKPLRSHIDSQWKTTNVKAIGNWKEKLFGSSWLSTFLMIIQGFYYLILYPSMFIGMAILFKRNKAMAFILLAGIIYFSLMILPPTTYARLKLPLLPFMYVFAAFGWTHISTLKKKLKWLTQKA